MLSIAHICNVFPAKQKEENAEMLVLSRFISSPVYIST